MGILQIVFLLSVCGCLQALRLPISDILEIEKLSKAVTIDLLKTLAFLDEDVGLSPKESIGIRQCVLFQKFKVLKNKIDMFNAPFEGWQVLDAIVNYIDIQPQLKLKLKDVNEKIDFIYHKYEFMGTLIRNETVCVGNTLEALSSLFVSYYSNSIPSVLDGIHAIVAPSEDGVPTVFEILIQKLRAQDGECKKASSGQQLVLYLYEIMALTELKGFLIMEFSYMILKLHNQGNFTEEIVAAQERYKGRSAITLKLAIEAVQSAPREFWKCDPYNQVKNETYIEISDEKGVNSDKYFSLFLEQSDLHNKMVVTGLRFVKKNRTIHLQIQQGKLLPMGKIDVTTVRWKPVENSGINSEGICNGQDCHALTYEKRGFDLDDPVAKEEKVLTGVKFGLIESVLQLQIHTTPFNFATGTLDVNQSVLWYEDISQKGRKKLNMDNKDVPIRDPDRFGSLSKPRMYLEFKRRDMDRDAAQRTPFIDAQAVTFEQPIPLSGAGVIYKGSKHFGGLIALKITTYNYKNVLRNAYDDHNYIYL